MYLFFFLITVKVKININDHNDHNVTVCVSIMPAQNAATILKLFVPNTQSSLFTNGATCC